MYPLERIDHLTMVTDDGRVANCICGQFRAEWLPISLRTWSPVRLVYSVAHYSWSTKGFSFKASYHFATDGVCGQKTFTTHSGELSSNNFSSAFSLNSFYHQQCTWILDSKVERQLFVEVGANETRPFLLCDNYPLVYSTTDFVRTESTVYGMEYIVARVLTSGRRSPSCWIFVASVLSA